MVNASSLKCEAASSYAKADVALTNLIAEASAMGENVVRFNVERYFKDPGTRNTFLENVRERGYRVTWCLSPYGYATDFVKVEW